MRHTLLPCAVATIAVAPLMAQPAATVYHHDYTFSTDPDPLALAPNSVTIAVGQRVRWVWVANFHSVVQVDGPGLATSPFRSILTDQIGYVFEHTFTQPGKYAYICEIHGSAPQPHHPQGMWGSVVVIPAPHAGAAILTLTLVSAARRRRDR